MKASAYGQRVLCVCMAMAAFLFVDNAYGQNSQSPDRFASLRRELDEAWAQRKAGIKALTMTTEIDQFIKGRGEQPLEPVGPFSDSRPRKDRVTRVVTEYAYEQGKIAITRSTNESIVPEDPEQVRPQTIRLTYDGTVNTQLIEETSLPMGSIIKEQTADRRLYVHVDFLAVNFWLHPKEVLQRIGWSVADMSVEEDVVEVNGVKCRRVLIPRKGNRWKSVLDLKPESGWVPVQWQTWLDGKLTMKLSIRYGVDEKVGPVVKDWSLVRYNDVGDTEKILRGQVSKYSINSGVDDALFTIQFPVGTHVLEKSNGERRYYRQDTDGLKPIDQREYGKRPGKVISNVPYSWEKRITSR